MVVEVKDTTRAKAKGFRAPVPATLLDSFAKSSVVLNLLLISF